jgi:hypothetical protein
MLQMQVDGRNIFWSVAVTTRILVRMLLFVTKEETARGVATEPFPSLQYIIYRVAETRYILHFDKYIPILPNVYQNE